MTQAERDKLLLEIKQLLEQIHEDVHPREPKSS
jgi:hypothetical protein